MIGWTLNACIQNTNPISHQAIGHLLKIGIGFDRIITEMDHAIFQKLKNKFPIFGICKRVNSNKFCA